jgi:hypothetical protein
VVEQHRAQGGTQERLRAYFRKLPPNTLALLTTEFEKALARGEDTAVAQFVLGELRKIARQADAGEKPGIEELQRASYAALEPFVVDKDETLAGQIKRASLQPIWIWLTQSALPDRTNTAVEELSAAKEAGRPADADRAVRRFQLAAAEAIAGLTSPQSTGADRQRSLGRIGSPAVHQDLPAVQTIFANREALDSFGSRLPRVMNAFGDTQVTSIKEHIAQLPSLQTPQVLPFVIALIMQRMTSPWQIIRLAVSYAGSDEESRVAATPFAVAVSMALHSLAGHINELHVEIRRGQFDQGAHHLKSLHDGVRDLRTELDCRSDSAWGRQLSAIRADISNALRAEIDGVPGRVRRLLRRRSDKDIQAGARIDAGEADETVALVNFVVTCRNYASELAISEVTHRSFSDLQHYLESATEGLVESLRASDTRVRAFRQLQLELAIRFCEIIFGHDYASLMTKAADVAVSGERKSRAG